jgi:hypothetical protein
MALAFARAGVEYVLCADLRDTAFDHDTVGSSAKAMLSTSGLITQRDSKGKAGFWEADIRIEEEEEGWWRPLLRESGGLMCEF